MQIILQLCEQWEDVFFTAHFLRISVVASCSKHCRLQNIYKQEERRPGVPATRPERRDAITQS